MIDLVFERAAEHIPPTGRKHSSFYERVAKGLWTPSCTLGPNTKAWPRHERLALMAAEMNGATEDELRALVKRLVEQRKELFHVLTGEAA